MGYRVAVAGATGAVGTRMLETLETRRFPVDELRPLASARSAGKRVRFGGRQLEVGELSHDSFAGIDIALFSAGGSVSREFAPAAAAAGAVVIDNTSAFRMEPDVPLVVPEVNGRRALERPRGIIANPNCSTIQMVVALDPLRRAVGLRRIVVATYQAVSGAGARAMEELAAQARSWAAGNPEPTPEVFARTILFDCLPQIGDFLPEGDTVEERKMVDETRKIFEQPELRVAPTAVRVPVMVSHGEAVTVELQAALSVDQAAELMRSAPGVELIETPELPLARHAAGGDAVLVGRLRADPSVEHGLSMWVTADNLRKGAALNAVQIAELLVAEGSV